MKTYLSERYAALKEEVDLFNEMGIAPVKKLSGIISAVRTALNDVKARLADASLDQATEIELFKYWKPRFVAEQIFAVEVFTVENNKPIGDELLLKNYYEQELRYIRRFFKQHRFLYQYYLLDGIELDPLYFVRGAEVPAILLPEVPNQDPGFSTAGDYLFAKFLAFERLQEWLINQLYPPTVAGTKRRNFRWTGDKSNLVELAYGIFCSAQINDGKCTIAELIEWLEESFDISLSRYYRRFAEIKMRKSISQSKYLDEMREAFLRYIEEGDAWKPRPGRMKR